MIQLKPTEFKLLRTWLPAGVIFLTIAVVCISFIFAPVKVSFLVEYPDGETVEQEYSFKGTGLRSSILRAESWKRYPDYTIGLGVATAISFGGFIFCVAMIGRELKETQEV